jgi:hypothetical protein
MANGSIVVWVTPDLVARPILNSQCQASRLILSIENSTPRCVMSDPDLRFTGRIRLAGSHGIGCPKMNSSAHNGSGMVCRRRWGPCEAAALLRRLQLTASDPSRSLVGFERIPRLALLALERAPSFAAGGRHQNQSGPAIGASRSFGLSHNINLPLDLAASPFQIRGAGKNNSTYLYVANGRQSLCTGRFGKPLCLNSSRGSKAILRFFDFFEKASGRARQHGRRMRGLLRGADVT